MSLSAAWTTYRDFYIGQAFHHDHLGGDPCWKRLVRHRARGPKHSHAFLVPRAILVSLARETLRRNAHPGIDMAQRIGGREVSDLVFSSELAYACAVNTMALPVIDDATEVAVS